MIYRKNLTPQAGRAFFPRGLKQPDTGYRFSLDSLLLACFSECAPGERILDLGTGCGVAGLGLLILHPKADLRITGLDISDELLTCARQNIFQLGFENQFSAQAQDLRFIKSSRSFLPESFDCALCNPPYRSLRQGRLSPSAPKNQARFETSGTLEDFLRAGAYLLKNKGRMNLVFPSASLNTLLLKLSACRLEPKRIRFVQAREKSRSSIFLLRAVKNANPGLIIDPPLILYSEQKERNIIRFEARRFCPFLAPDDDAVPESDKPERSMRNTEREAPETQNL